MQALLVANAASIYTTSGIYSVETYYDVFTLKLFIDTQDYVQLGGIFLTNMLLFLIIFNDAEEKSHEARLSRKKEEKQIEENKRKSLLIDAIQVKDELEVVEEKKTMTCRERAVDFVQTIYTAPF